jgi:peroxiredoxin
MKKIVFVIILFPLLSLSQSDKKLMIKKGMDTTEYIPLGLSIYSAAPFINGFSVNNEKINSEEILQEKRIVLIFYRGKWCPYCNKFLSNLNDSIKYISKRAEVLVVGPESFENTEMAADKAAATFTIIPDTSMKIQKDYDVLFNVTKKYQGKIRTFLRTDIAENNNQETAQLPVPAVYIIDKSGKISWRFFDYDYSKRPSIKEILDNLN